MPRLFRHLQIPLDFTCVSPSFILARGMSVSVSAAGEFSKGSPLLPVLAVRKSEVAYPTGRKDFAVMQPFPSAVSTAESDPYLMCDLFGPTRSSGEEKDPDTFPVSWHPHRGMDIATYLIGKTIEVSSSAEPLFPSFTFHAHVCRGPRPARRLAREPEYVRIAGTPVV